MTISDQIQIQIDDTINKQPYPTRCTITKIYPDNKHADIETSTGTIEYVETISNNLTVGNTGILIYLNNTFDDYIVLTK